MFSPILSLYHFERAVAEKHKSAGVSDESVMQFAVKPGEQLKLLGDSIPSIYDIKTNDITVLSLPAQWSEGH